MTVSKRFSPAEGTVPGSSAAAGSHSHPHDHPDHDLLVDMPAAGSYGAGVHPHVHDPESLRRIVNRLARIEGHIRGIKTMVQESRPCPDVLVQVAAVRGALDRVARIILDEHLTECISRAAEEGNIEDEIKQLKAALDRFLP
jgi:CsoR family transcriptional regulator, copper-sensing transcriptional repressor